MRNSFCKCFLVAIAAAGSIAGPCFAEKVIDWDHKLAKERQMIATNKIEEAMKILDDYLAKHPESGALHTDKGICLKRRGHVGEARSEFERATQVEPQYAQAWYELGSLQQSDKQFDQAADSFERYLQTKPYADNKDAVRDRINYCKSNM